MRKEPVSCVLSVRCRTASPARCVDSKKFAARSGLSCAVWRSKKPDAALAQEGSLHRRPPAYQGGSAEYQKRKESSEDVVAPVNDSAGHDRPHHRGSQRKEIHSGLHHRADGGTQTRRIFADAHLQGPRRESGARKGRCGISSCRSTCRCRRGWWRRSSAKGINDG